MDHYNFYIGGLLLSVNTFAGVIFFALAAVEFVGEPKTEPGKKELDSCTSARRKNELALMILAANAALVVVTMAFTFMERRHLMVWRVFAPKYIFEVLSFLVVEAVLLVTNLCIL